MQFNLYIFNQLFRTTLALTSVLVGIIWLFQTIKILELLVNRGAAVGDFLLMSIASMPLWLMIAIPISGFIAVNWCLTAFYQIVSYLLCNPLASVHFNWLRRQLRLASY